MSTHHLKNGNLFQSLLWLFLKVVMERDWLCCEDVDECLDNLVLCLTRHEWFSSHSTRTRSLAQLPSPRLPGPALSLLLSLPSLNSDLGPSFRYHGREFILKTSPYQYFRIN